MATAEYSPDIPRRGPVAASVVLSYSSPSGVASAVCMDANNCTYTYQQALTPRVVAVKPAELVGLTTLSINGSLFSSNVTLNKVKVGAYDCLTVLADPAYIQCVIDAPPGTVQPLSYSPGCGCRCNCAPRNGFDKCGCPHESTPRDEFRSPIWRHPRGDVGNKSCQVLTSNYSVVTCITPPQANGGYIVIVKLGVYLATAATNFTYSQSLTPNITSISPLSGQQGDNVTVTGTLFPTDSAQVFVSFNGSVCTVVSSSSTSVTCTLGPSFAGSYPVTVRVAGNGYARPVTSTLQFKYSLIATSVSPSNGSLAGMNTLVVYGIGFNPTSTVVTICGRVCGMASDPPQLTMLSCIVPSYTSSLPQSGAVTCDVTVTSQNSTVVLPNAYTYSKSLTPVVYSVNRTRGGTAGGSILMISGTGLTGAANVTIAGIACALLYQDFAQTIICETGPSGITVRAQVMVYINGMGFAQSAGVTFFYVDLWSSPFTWGGGPIPTDGDFVVIPSGQTLLLDTSTGVLSFLLIQGQLIFDDTQPFISLKAENILVTSGGLLQVGTEQQPYTNKAEIVLYGHVLSTELPVYGAKTLAVREGTLELHGQPLNVTWTRLAKTANAGDRTLYLTQAVDWQVGGSVVIAATGFVQTENEDGTIASIGSDGMSLTLSKPLNFTHIAAIQTIAGRTIETSAEFEIQSCFQGRFGAESVNDMFGSQIMIHAAMQNTARVAARIEYVEVTHAGQAFRLGRYPIHFHLNGNISGSYVRGCAIHHTFNRAVTIHAVNYLLVEKNVAYNIMGHAYSWRMEWNLLNVDITPATFWIVNPNNTVRRNAAAGGTHFGYWYRLPVNPTGPSATPLVCPRGIPLGILKQLCPLVWLGAELTEVGALQLRNSVLLDNNLVGLTVIRVDARWGVQSAALQGTLIVGQSNITTGCTPTGIRTPESYFFTVSNVTFVNFGTPDCVPIRACSHCKVNDGGFETRFEGIKFVNCTQVSQWQWPHEHLHRDMDGSLTGIRGGSLTPTHALLPRTCFNHNGSIGAVPGSVCPAGIQFGRFAVYSPSPSSLMFMSAAMLNQDGGNITLPFVQKRIAPTTEFQFKNPAEGPVVGAKAIGVFGQMSLHGKQRSTWTRLDKSALVGQSSLTLINTVDWNPNDTIVVTSTSFDPSETEVFKVVSVSGAVVTLNATLKYNHTAETETIGTLSYSVRGEVGLLTRNIVIQGDQSTTGFGCRVLIGTYKDLSGMIYTGSAQIRGVEISGCGQLGYNEAYDPRYSLAFLNTFSNNYVNGCSIHDGYNIGLGVFGTDAMVIAGNVIHVTVGPAMFVTGSNHQVIQNLASLSLFPGTYGGVDQPLNSVWTANFELANTQGLTLVGNSAAGGARAGYHFNGESCSSSSVSGIVFAQALRSSIYDNVAHSSLHGIHLGYADGQPGGCAYFNRFTIFSCFHYGLFSFGISGAWISNSVFVNNFAAIFVTVIGPKAVSHIAGDKPVLIQDSIIVGASPVYQTNCAGDSNKPPIASHLKSFFGIQSPYGSGHVGVVLTTFTSGPAEFPKFPWFDIRSYPAINGLTEMRNVTFAHFKRRCTTVVDLALITNPISQDGIHPTTLRQINLYDVQVNASLFIHEPLLKAINPSDCVDMDCDGFKKVLIRDLDGSFTGVCLGNQQRGIGDYRIPPPAMLTFPNGSKESVALTYPAKGIVRGTTFASSANCAYNAMWNAYLCSQLDHLMFVLESLDIDTETRRLSPVGMAANGFIDLINGPEDFGWCGGYTCQERISTFYIIVATGLSYTIGLTSTNPQNTSLRLLNANSSQAIVVGIIYTNPQRLDIYYQGNYVPPTNADRTSTDLKYLQFPPANRTSFAPLISDVVGTNYYDRQLKQLFVVIKGSSPITVVTTPVVQVSLSLFVTAEQFFNEAMLVSNIAFLLGIPSNKIRIVSIVKESGVGKRQTPSSSALQLSFEIGDAPVQQIGGTPTTSINATTNITASANVTNSTSSGTNATNISSNGTAAGQISLNYTSLVMLTTTLANAIQTGELASALNSTISTATLVEPVAPPSPPPPPATNDTAVQQAINGTVQQPSVVLSIPTALRIVYFPSVGVEGVAFQSPIRIAMYDNNGVVATTLGVGASWICTAVIASGPSAAFLTSFTANFSNGIATFSNLVISYPGTYTLLFTVTFPSNAQFNITTQPITIAARQLKLVVTYPSTGTALVPLYPYPNLTLVDSQTGALVQDLSWRNSTWYASITVKSTSGTVYMYQSWTVPFQMGMAIFKNVVVTTSGSYVLVFSAVTDPGSALVPSPFTTPSFVVSSVPIARFIVVYQANYTAVVSGKEEQFKTSFKTSVQSMYPDVTIYNITVGSGSIVVTFFAGAQTTQSIQNFV
eukprot:Em0019g1124a